MAQRSNSILEIAKSKKKQELSINLPNDCISCILVRLPIQSLHHFRFVCKPWYKIINHPTFINAHLQTSKTVLIFQSPVINNIDKHFPHLTKPLPNTPSVEFNLSKCPFGLISPPINQRLPSYNIKFLTFQDGKAEINDYNISCLGEIKATCNGLILLTDKINKGGLILMNPVTRDLLKLPLGTISSPGYESYGFAFCSRTKEYKVVHLFQDSLKYLDCEILNISTQTWRPIYAPSFGRISWFGFKPVLAEEALYWVPHIDYNEYLISMSMDNEKFMKIVLPKTCRSHDKIFEMDGFLGLMTYEAGRCIVIWNLKRLSEEGWVKKFKIFDCSIRVTPLYSVKDSGEIIFTRNGILYAYDTCLNVTTKIQVEKGFSGGVNGYLPHVNSLVSWREVQEEI